MARLSSAVAVWLFLAVWGRSMWRVTPWVLGGGRSGGTAQFALAPVVVDRDVLAAARGFADQIFAAELGWLSAALEWVRRNPGVFMSRDQDRWGTGQMGQVDWEGVAKAGCVLVDEMSIPEFAYATGMSQQVARSLIHDAVVMFYRFPRTWPRMSSGQVPRRA